MAPFKPTAAPNTKPQCPNHHVDLVDLGFPIPRKGKGTCPVSNQKFDFEVDTEVLESEQEVKIDKNGKPYFATKWIIEGDD